MTAGANKFLRRYYGKVRDCFTATDPPLLWIHGRPLIDEVMKSPLVCQGAQLARPVKDAAGAA